MLHRHNRVDKALGNATLADVKKEMAKPRIARSAKIAELHLDALRIAEQPSATLPGIVDKIIPPSRPSHTQKAQITVYGANRQYRDIRVENTLTDENGNDVRLKKGAQVEVTVTAEPKPSVATTRKRVQPTRH
jgi:hypothetical protein